jgi:polyhydroxybutyrate depolymerase
MTSYEGDDRMESFMQADFTRFFRVHVPRRTELGPAAPLVLVFHGSSQNAEQIRALSGLDAAADEAGFIVAYLEAPMGAWDVFDNLGGLGLDDLAYVREVIDRVDRAYVMDRRRVIAVGLSNGGVFSQQLGCKLADRIAGFVSVAASMPRLMATECAPGRPVSALFLLGTADSFFPVAGGGTVLSADSTMQFWGRANDCSGSRTRTALPDIADDGTVVYRSWYRSCDDGARTELDSIVGGGHAWPDGAIAAPASFGPTSRDISANNEIIRFLQSIPRR